MADQIDVPAVGRVDRRYVYAAVALVAGIVGYAWWKRRQGAAVVVDPTTGGLGDTSTFSNPNPGATGSASVDTTGPDGPPTTNEQWSAKVVDTLGSLFDAGFISTTLGKYLGGQALTADEAALVRTAWAFHGHPPVNPPDIHLATGGSTPGTGSTTTDTTRHATVVAGWHVDEWINDVRAGKAGFPAPNFSYDQLLALNGAATVTGNINWNSGRTHNTADNTFKSAATYRVV